MNSQRQLFLKYLGLPSLDPLGLEITSAKGIYLYGPDGKDYIDLVSGVAVSNLGHQNPEVVQAVMEQVQRHMHLMVYGDLVQSPQVELARMISEVLPPSLNSTYFVNSGSEAVEGAIKLAKRHTGRPGIAAFKNAYHGGTLGALSICGNERLKNAFRPLLPDVTLMEFNSFKDLEYITENTACVVIETIQAEGGIILPEPDFLPAVQERCRKTGTLLVVDDIQMGMGRTGKLFSFEHFGVVPDILCLAKAFGGGMPLGAFISSKETMQSLAHDPELGHITTFGGHPVSCAAALSALKYLVTSKIYLDAEMKAEIFLARLKGHPAIQDIRHKGLMIGVDLDSTVNTAKLIRSFINNGLIADTFLFRPYSFRIAPPLTITPDEIEIAYNRVISSLNNL